MAEREAQVMSEQLKSETTISIGPPWWRCENGNEFRSGHNRPARCPVCGSTNIEMVVDLAPEFRSSEGTDSR